MRKHRPERRRRQMRLHRPRMLGFLSSGAQPTLAQPTTGRREAASWRSSGQVALPVTTRVKPAGLVRYIERWPRAGVVLRFQACPLTEDGGSAVPLLVIRRTNAAGSALVSSSEASST